MWKFFKSIYARSMLTFIASLVTLQAYVTLQFNDWYKVFYNSLEDKSYEAFTESFINRGDLLWYDVTSWGFIPLAALSIVLYAYTQYLGNNFSFRWRESITRHYLPLWERCRDLTEGSSQRIQEDTMKFALKAQILGQGLLRAIVILALFIPVLWDLSSVFDIEGYLVWIAIVISLGGLGISAVVGRKLPKLEYDNQVVEATFRKSLVKCEDDREAFTVSQLLKQLQDLKICYFKLYDNYKIYSLWEMFYFQAGVVLPYIIAAPQFFAGVITLGILAQIGNAFGKIHESMSFLTDQWMVVTELKSVMTRLNEFEESLDEQS